MDSLMIHRSIPCLKLFKISRKTLLFLCSLSVLLVGNTNMVGHVYHIPWIHCLGDYCAIWCYTNRLSRILRIALSSILMWADYLLQEFILWIKKIVLFMVKSLLLNKRAYYIILCAFFDQLHKIC